MSDVLLEREPHIFRVTLNRPSARNALTRQVVRSVTAALESVANDAGVRAVVITGGGGHFCAGADLRKTFEEDPDFLDHLDEYMREYHALIRSIVFQPNIPLQRNGDRIIKREWKNTLRRKVDRKATWSRLRPRRRKHKT